MKYLVVVVLSFLILTPVSAAEFETNLRYGARGTEVKKLQEFLADNDFYTGPITGNFYSLTLKAVKKFQTSRGLPATGFFGGFTRAEANLMLENELKDQETEPEFTGSAVVVASSTNDFLDFQNRVLQAQLEEQRRQTQLLLEQGQRQQELLQQQQNALNQVVENTTVVQPVVETPTISPTVPTPSPKLYNFNGLIDLWNDSNSIRIKLPNLTPNETTVKISIDGQTYTEVATSNVFTKTITNLRPETNYSFTVELSGREYGTFTGSKVTSLALWCGGTWDKECFNYAPEPILVKGIQFSGYPMPTSTKVSASGVYDLQCQFVGTVCSFSVYVQPGRSTTFQISYFNNYGTPSIIYEYNGKTTKY